MSWSLGALSGARSAVSGLLAPDPQPHQRRPAHGRRPPRRATAALARPRRDPQRRRGLAPHPTWSSGLIRSSLPSAMTDQRGGVPGSSGLVVASLPQRHRQRGARQRRDVHGSLAWLASQAREARGIASRFAARRRAPARLEIGERFAGRVGTTPRPDTRHGCRSARRSRGDGQGSHPPEGGLRGLPRNTTAGELTLVQQRLVNIALLVRDYDEAIAFYTAKLGFTLVEDTPLSATKRWVRLRPPGADGFVACCWPRQPTRSNAAGSATRPAGGCSCSSTPTTASATTRIWCATASPS